MREKAFKYTQVALCIVAIFSGLFLENRRLDGRGILYRPIASLSAIRLAEVGDESIRRSCLAQHEKARGKVLEILTVVLKWLSPALLNNSRSRKTIRMLALSIHTGFALSNLLGLLGRTKHDL